MSQFSKTVSINTFVWLCCNGSIMEQLPLFCPPRVTVWSSFVNLNLWKLMSHDPPSRPLSISNTLLWSFDMKSWSRSPRVSFTQFQWKTWDKTKPDSRGNYAEPGPFWRALKRFIYCILHFPVIKCLLGFVSAWPSLIC